MQAGSARQAAGRASVRRLLWFVIACAFVCPAMAQTYQRTAGLCADGGQQPVTNGVIASGIVPIGSISPSFTNGTGVVGSYPGCTVTVYNTGTITLSSIFSDSIGTPKANPFTASLVDGYWFFYAANGAYDVQLSNAGIVTPFLTNTFTVNVAAGADTDVQVNCSGLFCGYAGLTWVNSTTTLTATHEAITTSLTIGGGTPLATTNQSGIGSLCLTTNCALTTPTLTSATINGATLTNGVLAGTFTGNPTASGNWLFSGTNNHTGAETFSGASSNFTVASTTGNSLINLNSTFGGHTSTIDIEAVTSNGNNGEFQFHIVDASPCCFKFIATNANNFPLQIDAGSVTPSLTSSTPFVDIGHINANQVTLTAAGNNGILLHAATGNDTTAKILAVNSNGFNGEVQFQIANASPRGWEYVNTNSSVTSVFFNGVAPANTLQTTAAGNVQTAGNFCFSANQCVITGAFGAGAPTGGLCGASNTGTLLLNSTATTASNTMYVCQGSTWSAVTVP